MDIAIIGGGVGGLVLARILQRHGLEPVVYERESSRAARGQGGSLDLHEPTGQRALRDAGLHDGFLERAQPEGEDLRLLDPSGKVHYEEAGEGGARPEIERGELRDLLLDSLRPGTVHWGHSFAGLDNGKLRFDNGNTASADLVVGADGAWSRVRRTLVDAEPEYCGLGHLESRISDLDRRYPELAKVVGRGALWCLGDDRLIAAQRVADGSAGVALGLRKPAEWFDAPPADPAVEFAGWAPEVTALIGACDEPFTTRRLYTLPIGMTWPHVPNRTMIGDAAHLMTPFGGQGANLALLDGAELARTIVSGGDIAEFEEEMRERARPAAEFARLNMDRMIAPGGIEATMAIVAH